VREGGTDKGGRYDKDR